MFTRVNIPNQNSTSMTDDPCQGHVSHVPVERSRDRDRFSHGSDVPCDYISQPSSMQHPLGRCVSTHGCSLSKASALIEKRRGHWDCPWESTGGQVACLLAQNIILKKCVSFCVENWKSTKRWEICVPWQTIALNSSNAADGDTHDFISSQGTMSPQTRGSCSPWELKQHNNLLWSAKCNDSTDGFVWKICIVSQRKHFKKIECSLMPNIWRCWLISEMHHRGSKMIVHQQTKIWIFVVMSMFAFLAKTQVKLLPPPTSALKTSRHAWHAPATVKMQFELFSTATQASKTPSHVMVWHQHQSTTRCNALHSHKIKETFAFVSANVFRLAKTTDKRCWNTGWKLFCTLSIAVDVNLVASCFSNLHDHKSLSPQRMEKGSKKGFWSCERIKECALGLGLFQICVWVFFFKGKEVSHLPVFMTNGKEWVICSNLSELCLCHCFESWRSSERFQLNIRHANVAHVDIKDNFVWLCSPPCSLEMLQQEDQMATF